MGNYQLSLKKNPAVQQNKVVPWVGIYSFEKPYIACGHNDTMSVSQTVKHLLE
jgi:hypothetical protein